MGFYLSQVDIMASKRGKNKLSPMEVLRKLPINSTLSKKHIDPIQNIKCSSKVLCILMEKDVMIEYTSLGEYILKDPDFQHISLPSIQVLCCDDDLFGNDSYSINDYIKLAKLIEKNYYEYDGFVIIGNLGRLAYASSYLSFMLENIAKPVVFTSSTVHLDHAFNDAKSNLISSLIIASRSHINEVCVCFDRKVYRG